MAAKGESKDKSSGKEAKLSPVEKGNACSYCDLANRGFCGGLTDAQKVRFAEAARLTVLNTHRTLFRQGETSDHVYIVRNGILRLYQRLFDGRRQIIGFAKPGDLLLFPLEKQNDYSADALDSSYLCQFRRQDFLIFLQAEPDIFATVARAVYEDLDRARHQIALLGQRKATPKVAQFLLALHENFAEPDAAGARVPLRIPQADIADFLGLTVETVNRTLARCARAGLIRISKEGTHFLDLRRLAELAEDY